MPKKRPKVVVPRGVVIRRCELGNQIFKKNYFNTKNVSGDIPLLRGVRGVFLEIQLSTNFTLHT